RFGYYDNTFNMGNWYPILCVYDEKGWNLEPYHSTGDPFYSNVSNYKVSIRAPKEYIIASTGEVMNIGQEGQVNTWELQAQAVRDFAWVASDKFKIASAEVGDTMVYSYYYGDENEGEKALDFGVAALETFNKLFGRYPYKNLSIVQTDFFIGGMEYPRLVMIDGSLYGPGQGDWLEAVTVHEVAHQWWYGIVGNDQVHEAWLDEALTEYSTILYYGQFYDKEKEESKYKELITMGRYGLFKIYYSHEDIDETIHKPLYEFEDWLVYDSLVYGKGSMMIHDMRQRMGDELFFETFRKYFEDNQFKNAGFKDLLKSCEDITGYSWYEFFEEWLYDK
ncbi:MAG TPA: M1 family metallopeptidase, partial [Clostridia bacterium]|nr:M1 family metallopeptidase [Clostridia bacterium]